MLVNRFINCGKRNIHHFRMIKNVVNPSSSLLLTNVYRNKFNPDSVLNELIINNTITTSRLYCKNSNDLLYFTNLSDDDT